jgi:hypothetical protein
MEGVRGGASFSDGGSRKIGLAVWHEMQPHRPLSPSAFSAKQIYPQISSRLALSAIHICDIGFSDLANLQDRLHHPLFSRTQSSGACISVTGKPK